MNEQLKVEIIWYDEKMNYLTISVNGMHYTYDIVSPYVYEKIRLKMKYAPGRALNYIKKNFKLVKKDNEGIDDKE